MTVKGAAAFLTAVAVMVSMGPASAEMSDPPACEQDIYGGCLGGPGGMNTGFNGSPAAVGRTFLTADDVTGVISTMMSATYIEAQWDSLDEFVDAMKTYWNLNAPANRTCSFDANSAARAGACTSVGINQYPNRDGSTEVVLIPNR